MKERAVPGLGPEDRWRCQSPKLGLRIGALGRRGDLGAGEGLNSGSLSCGPNGFRMPEQHPTDMLTGLIYRHNKMKFGN